MLIPNSRAVVVGHPQKDPHRIETAMLASTLILGRLLQVQPGAV